MVIPLYVILDRSSCSRIQIPSYLFSMTVTIENSSYNTEARASPSPVRLGLPEEHWSVHVPDETSPLLPVQPESVPKSRAPQSLSERWHSTVSTFLDTNAGLLLIVAAQFLFAASNITVKWLNSSENQIPMLEVRDAPRIIGILN
jgi:hypothetical protein